MAHVVTGCVEDGAWMAGENSYDAVASAFWVKVVVVIEIVIVVIVIVGTRIVISWY